MGRAASMTVLATRLPRSHGGGNLKSTFIHNVHGVLHLNASSTPFHSEPDSSNIYR